MANGKDNASEQNISEVLAMLRQSVDADSSAQASENIAPAQDYGISDEDLKQKLRSQYMSESESDEAEEGDSYELDEEFLEEAVNATDEPEEIIEDEPEEIIEDEPEEIIEDEPEEIIEDEPEEIIEDEPEEIIEDEPEEELAEEFEEESEEELDEEFEGELEEEPTQEPEEDDTLPWEESEDGTLTAEDIRTADEEFSFLDPSLLRIREEPISEEVIHIESPIPESEEIIEDEPEEIIEDEPEEIAEDEPEEIAEDEPEEIIEDEHEEIIEDDDLTFEDLEVNGDDDDGVVYETLSLEPEDDDDDALTFEDLVTDESADDGLTYESISLDGDLEDDDLTFDQLREREVEDENEANIFYAPIPTDEEGEPSDLDAVGDDEDIESFLGDYFTENVAVISDEAEALAEPFDVEPQEQELPLDESEQTKEAEEASAEELLFGEDEAYGDLQEGEDDALGEEEENDFGFFGEGDELGEYYPELKSIPDYTPSGADISLLLQFGCDNEVLSIASDEDIASISNEEALDKISKSISLEDGEDEPALSSKEALEAKIHSIYNNYSRTRGGIFLRLIVASFISFLLLLYDGLPLLGVSLPGIMDRDFYFVPHVLIGLQLLVICAFTSGRRFLKGLKGIFTRGSDAYTTAAILLIGVIVYDVFIMIAPINRPPEFHFLASIAITLAIAAECAELSSVMATYRFFFADAIARADGEDMADSENSEKYYTLHRSAGKGSVAEKMYRGGLDPSQKVYSPLEVESAAGYFNSHGKKSRRSQAPMVMIIPSIVFSVLIGILYSVVSRDGGELWESVGIALFSLALTLPVFAVIARWLPFAAINYKNIDSGFAFSDEYSEEQYADCDVFVFKDMHLLEKCSPKSVNLATYDATSSDVLLGCLGAVYSAVGGPLEGVFAVDDSAQSLGECRIKRIAKSGVEAVVGTNYAVLIGNEQFMSRYGISFPKVNFKRAGDEVFSVCVSINGRASARIVAKYSVNPMFEMFAQRLAEDGVYCAVETFDPMVSSALLKKIREDGRPPVSVVHLGVADFESRRIHKESALFDANGEETGVLAKRSRLNLVVAASNAARGSRLRGRANAYCYAGVIAGAALSVVTMLFGSAEAMNEFLITLYWLVGIGGLFALVMLGLPRKDRFSFEHFANEKKRSLPQKKQERASTKRGSVGKDAKTKTEKKE